MTGNDSVEGAFHALDKGQRGFIDISDITSSSAPALKPVLTNAFIEMDKTYSGKLRANEFISFLTEAIE